MGMGTGTGAQAHQAEVHSSVSIAKRCIRAGTAVADSVPRNVHERSPSTRDTIEKLQLQRRIISEASQAEYITTS